MTEKRFLQLGGKIKRDNKERNAVNMVMTVHDENGNEFHITKDEAERIAGELAKMGGHETNKAFMERAAENIKMATGMKPKTEDEAKEILYRMIPGWTKQHVEAVFETMEWIAGMHKQKVG